MKIHIPAAALAVLFYAPAHGQEANCNNPLSQAELNYCAGIDAQSADDELNHVWRQIQAYFTGDSYDRKRKAKLLTAQRAWIAYRDAECEGSVAQDWEGGSGQPMAVAGCIAAMTKARTNRLRDRFLNR